MRVSLTKTVGFLVAVSAIIFAVTGYISIFKLNTPTQDLYHVTAVKPDIKDLTIENFAELMKREEAKFVAFVSKEGKITYLVHGFEDENKIEYQSTIEETMLQYVSGSNLGHAGNCPNRQFKHGVCIGPVYEGDSLVAPRECTCVLK